MKRAVVTGGMGFIGSHVTELLLERGIPVAVIDNLATGKQHNLQKWLTSPLLTWFNTDIVTGDLKPCFEKADTVFHLAALADIVPSIQKPLDYGQTNMTGTLRVLEAARHAGIRRFVYAASSSCYGIPEQYPTPETAPIQPEYPYALSKRVGEELVLHWGKVYGMNVISLRLFNVYGPRSRTTGAYGAVIGVFLAQKLAGKPLTIVGDGSQRRDFIYVTDVAEAFGRAADSDLRQEIFNVGAGQPVSVDTLAGLVGGPRVFIPRRPGEPDQTWADISKIHRFLGWQPRISFQEGMQRILEHIDSWRDAPVWTPESIAEANKDWFRYLGSQERIPS